MAAMDNFLVSQLYNEMTSRFDSGAGTPPPITVGFLALELACQQTPTTDGQVVAIVDLITAATSWKAKVLFSEQKIEFRK